MTQNHQVQETEQLISDESTPLLPSEIPIPTKSKEILGLFFMGLSAIGFSIMSVFVKLAGKDFPVLQIVFVRSLLQLIGGLISCCIVRVEPYGPKQVNKGLLLLRGLAGSISLAIYFFVLTAMPLGDGTTLFFTGPAFTAIAARIFLGEALSRLDGVSIFACLCGVGLVSRPQFLFGHEERLDKYPIPTYIPASAAILGAMVSAFAYCLVRIVGKRVHFAVHVTYFGAISTLFSGIAAYTLQSPLPISSWTLLQWVYLMSIGVFAFTSQTLLNASLQCAPAGPATLMRNLDVVFAFLFGLFIFDEKPFITSIIGAFMIVGTTGFVGFIKWGYCQRSN